MIEISLAPKKYGIPYQGNKSKVIKHIAPLIPPAENFYDLFGGGFSVTHFMMVNRGGDFGRFHFNEIRPGVCGLIRDAIAGKYSYSNFTPGWVSREDFLSKKDSCAYTKLIWSFGNNGRDYLFGRKIEANKRSMHQCVVHGEFDNFCAKLTGIGEWPPHISGPADRRLFMKRKIRDRIGERIDLQQLQQLERLQQLEQLEQLQFYSLDYRAVPIMDNSVTYCDIPYGGTASYDGGKNFDRAEFLEWAAESPHPTYVSEYDIKDDRFHMLKEIETRSTMAAKGSVRATERVYCNEAAMARIAAAS